MNANPFSAPNPFSVRSVLVMVLFGAVVFVALLWMIGSGMTSPSGNNGGAHAASKGLNGYAAVVQLLEKRGYKTSLSRSAATLDDPGLLILTPPHNAKGAEIERIVSKRRYIGPTLVITPKWQVQSAADAKGGKRGWVQLGGTAAPNWPGFMDEVGVAIGRSPKGWSAAGLSGELPVPATTETGAGEGLEPLVLDRNGGILAAYFQDKGYYPALEDLALERHWEGDGKTETYPVILVFEPDLLDNYGMARKENAQLAERLVAAALSGSQKRVAFDVTLNGLGRSPNLLTLAFTPPFLAATLCLLLAALALGWRAFLRFGPPLASTRQIAFGKRPLVANAAGLIRRTGRLHLVTGPYADHLRERIARTLGLPRQPTPQTAEAAIDQALAQRLPDAPAFSALAARLRAERRPLAILRAAQELHSLERKVHR
jgi:hypothetical protein